MQFYIRGNLNVVAVKRQEDEEPEISFKLEFPYMRLEYLISFLSTIRWHLFPWECDDGYCDGYCEDLETIIDLEGGEQL